MVVVGEDAPEVAAGLGVGEFVDEEGFVGRGVVEPGVGFAGAGVVAGEGGDVVAVGEVAHPAQVVCAEADADDGQVEELGGVVGVVEALGDLGAGAGDDLGEADGAGVGARLRLEDALLQDQAVEEPGVELKVRGVRGDEAGEVSGIGDALEEEGGRGDALGRAELDETVGGGDGETVGAQGIEAQHEGVEGGRIVEIMPVDQLEQVQSFGAASQPDEQLPFDEDGTAGHSL